jgi:hypothetical protein
VFPVSIGEYLLFALLTVFMSAGFVVLSMILECTQRIVFPVPLNPLKLFLLAATPPVRLFREPPASFGGRFNALVMVSVFWPLTLAPLHFLGYRVLGWPPPACLGLFLASGFVTAFVALCNNE